MLRNLFKSSFVQSRSFKNFGHKRQPIPLHTTLWHGFLTVTFIGLGLKWEFLSSLIFGNKDYDEEFNNKLQKRMEIE